MKYQVVFSDDALADVRSYLDYIARENQMPLTAERWWGKALVAVDTLEHFPNRCEYAPENVLSKLTLRKYRVDNCLFIYRVDEVSKTVRILRMRHRRQLPYSIDKP